MTCQGPGASSFWNGIPADPMAPPSRSLMFLVRERHGETENQRRNRVKHKSVIIAGAVVSLLGCANSPHLVYYSSRVLGVDTGGNPSPTGPSGHFNLGYERKLAAIIPKSSTAESKTNGYEAVSMLAKSEMDADFLTIPRIRQRVATGEAAVALAGDPSKVKDFMDGKPIVEQ